VSVPADRPLSLARLRALPVGARVRDAGGREWWRERDLRTGNPGWFRDIAWGFTASYATLHADHQPLQLLTPVTSSVPSGDGS
jgi:hypothetical protein